MNTSPLRFLGKRPSAEASLWERALDTWGQAELGWKEVRIRSTQETFLDEDGVGSFQPYEDEKEQQRLKVLVPLSRHLVKAQRWKQAWRLFCELEEASMKISVGRAIATALDQIQQSGDAQMIWRQTSEIALTSQLSWHDLEKLASALQQVQRREEADTIWKTIVKSILETDEDDFGSRAINCGWLALRLAQAQRGEEAELLLKESMQAAASAQAAAKGEP